MGFKLTIKDVQNQTGVSGYALRYYEKIGLLHEINRLKNGHRSYTDSDIELIKTIKLLRSTCMPIHKIMHLMRLRDEGDRSVKERISYLRQYQRELREQISMLESTLKTIDAKIARHEKLIR